MEAAVEAPPPAAAGLWPRPIKPATRSTPRRSRAPPTGLDDVHGQMQQKIPFRPSSANSKWDFLLHIAWRWPPRPHKPAFRRPRCFFISPSHNKLPDFSSSIASARVASSFSFTPTGVLLEKSNDYSTKRNTATEIRKFLSSRRPCGEYPALTPHSAYCI